MQKLKVSIIGAGLMGRSIAMTFARYGQHVSIYDKNPDALSQALPAIKELLIGIEEKAEVIDQAMTRLVAANSLEESVSDADFITEAVSENLDLKRNIFSQIEEHAPVQAILASNTSVIPISEIMGGLKHSHRALGTHWWNPAHLIPLVEVIKTQWTEEGVVQRTVNLLESVQKQTAIVSKDVPGFIGNRLQHALWREAISLVENGICSAEAVDTVVKTSFGRRLAILGPLENADLVGTDLTLDIHKNILFDLETNKAPSPLLEKMQLNREYGMKSGKGFYVWQKGDEHKLKEKLSSYLSEVSDLLDG